MIGAILGLFKSTYLANNASYNFAFGSNTLTKSALLHRAQNMTMYKMATAQQDYYRKLINKNIEQSFNIFA